MNASRDAIPEETKRAVRQRCHFGCVICGSPLYHYDHLVDWAIVKCHKQGNLTLLCPNHHSQKTSGLLPIADVRRANDNPFNKVHGKSAPLSLHYTGPNCRVLVGAVQITAPPGRAMCALRIDETPIIQFRKEDQHLLLSLNLFDERNNLFLQVVDNQLVVNSAAWDITFVGRRIIVRQALGKLLVDLEFRPPELIRIRRGRIMHNGVELYVQGDHVMVLNTCNGLKGIAVESENGIALGSERGLLSFPNIPRSGYDRSAAIKFMRNSMRL